MYIYASVTFHPKKKEKKRKGCAKEGKGAVLGVIQDSAASASISRGKKKKKVYTTEEGIYEANSKLENRQTSTSLDLAFCFP